MASAADLTERLSRLALFADVPRAEVESLAARGQEASFREGVFVIRRGEPGLALYVILEGEAASSIDDVERLRLPVGAFFGEVSVLLDEPVLADIVARSPLRCLVVPAAEVEELLLASPRTILNMLKTEARRVRSATEWHN